MLYDEHLLDSMSCPSKLAVLRERRVRAREIKWSNRNGVECSFTEWVWSMLRAGCEISLVYCVFASASE